MGPYPANLADSDPHVTFDKIITFQDKLTFMPVGIWNRNEHSRQIMKHQPPVNPIFHATCLKICKKYLTETVK